MLMNLADVVMYQKEFTQCSGMKYYARLRRLIADIIQARRRNAKRKDQVKRKGQGKELADSDKVGQGLALPDSERSRSRSR